MSYVNHSQPVQLANATVGSVGHAAQEGAAAAQLTTFNGDTHAQQSQLGGMSASDAQQTHQVMQQAVGSCMYTMKASQQQALQRLQGQQEHKQQQQQDPGWSLPGGTPHDQQAYVAHAQQHQQLQQLQQTPQGGWGLPPLPPGAVQQQQVSQQRQQQQAPTGASPAANLSAASGPASGGPTAAADAEGMQDAGAGTAAAAPGGPPAINSLMVRMCHVLGDNGRIDIGGGICFKLPMWYDDLAKTGLVPR